VADEVASQFAVGKVPDLHKLVPSSRHNHRIGAVGRKSDTADPFGVTRLVDGIFALSEGVPELNGLISRTRNDLSVVGGKSDAKHVLGVADESSSGGSKVKVP